MPRGVVFCGWSLGLCQLFFGDVPIGSRFDELRELRRGHRLCLSRRHRVECVCGMRSRDLFRCIGKCVLELCRRNLRGVSRCRVVFKLWCRLIRRGRGTVGVCELRRRDIRRFNRSIIVVELHELRDWILRFSGRS